MTDTADSTSRVDYAARRRDRASERRLERRGRIPVAVVVAAVVVLLILVLAEVASSWGRVHPGVSVAGVRVGGMRPDAAASALETSLPGKVNRPVVVKHEDQQWEVAAGDVGLSFDYEAMVDDAMAVGRQGGVLKAFAGRVRGWAGGVELVARPIASDVRMDTALDRIAKGTDVAPVNARVVIDGREVSTTPAKDGLGLDRDLARRRILAAMVAVDRDLLAPVKVVEVPVSDADAEAARLVAERMLEGAAVITFGDKSWEFGPSDIARWISFRRSDVPAPGSAETATAGAIEPTSAADITLLAYIAPAKVGKTIVPAVGTKIGKPAKNAEFKTNNGRVSIVPSVQGVGPDLDQLAVELTDELAAESSDRTVELRTAEADPEITTEEAKEMGIKERISRYTTTYDAGNRPRVNNIHLLGDSLDGQLIAPGATFSFNGAIGERTAAKGYQEANAIVNGKLVPQLGGGICQVGTTLFNTAYESGMPIVERRNHSFYISHYPDGRDATVSWGGPDLKFKNDTDKWMLISVSYSSSSITIALYGTDPGYDVESEKGSWTNIRPFPTEEIKDPTLLKGKRVVEDGGIKGRRITVTRTVYHAGEVVRTDTFVSVYKPKVEVVRVGTKPRPTNTRPPGSGTTTGTTSQ